MARDDDEDGRPAGRKKLFEPPILDALSIAELDAYITDLKGEIHRTEEAIRTKRNVRAGADSLFGRKNS